MKTWFTPANIVPGILDKKGPLSKVIPPPEVTWYFEVGGKVHSYKVLYGFHCQHGWQPSVKALRIWLVLDGFPEWLEDLKEGAPQ